MEREGTGILADCNVWAHCLMRRSAAKTTQLPYVSRPPRLNAVLSPFIISTCLKFKAYKMHYRLGEFAADTRYYTRCYFNVRSKADTSQLNRNQQLTSGGKKKKKL